MNRYHPRQSPKESEATKNNNDRDWLETDLSRLNEYEPYDWGDLDPLTLGQPVQCISGQGFVVDA